VSGEGAAANSHGATGPLSGRASGYPGSLRSSLLGGGILVLILSSVLFLREHSDLERGTVGSTGIREIDWIACWLIAMVLVAIYSSFLMLRESRSEGTPFPPKGLKKVLGACWVPMLIGGIVGTVLVISLTPAVGAAFWAACFGVALLATRGSAPRVISRLGWLILPSGLMAVAYSWSDGMHPLPLLGVPEHLESPMLEADLIMGVCFGLIPLVYGAIFVKDTRTSR